MVHGTGFEQLDCAAGWKLQRLALVVVITTMRGPGARDAGSVAVDAAAPGRVDEHGRDAEDEEGGADGAADEVVVVGGDGDAVPEGPAEVGADVEDEGEQLQDANDEGDGDGEGGEDGLVVEDGERVAGEAGGGIEAHHGGAVEGVEQAHARGEEQREQQDEPDGGAVRGLERRDAQQRDLRRCVEPEPEQHPERVHLPRPVDEAEGAFQQRHHAAGALELVIEGGLTGREGDGGTELLEEFVEDVGVHDAEDDQERGRDGGADDRADLRKAAEAVGDGGRAGGHDDGSHDDNGRVPEREEGPHGDGTLACGDQSSCHQVNRRDVVRIQGMPKSQSVCQDRSID
nr:hypothetical protein CFP56_24484 [Quercus suber]